MMLHRFSRALAVLINVLLQLVRGLADFLFLAGVALGFFLRLFRHFGHRGLQLRGLRGIDGSLHALRLIVGPLIGRFRLREKRFVFQKKGVVGICTGFERRDCRNDRDERGGEGEIDDPPGTPFGMMGVLGGFVEVFFDFSGFQFVFGHLSRILTRKGRTRNRRRRSCHAVRVSAHRLQESTTL